MSEEITYSEIDIRKLIQKALQDDRLYEHDKVCDLDWLLYRVRLGGGCIRMFANLNALFRATDTIDKEIFYIFSNNIHFVFGWLLICDILVVDSASTGAFLRLGVSTICLLAILRASPSLSWLIWIDFNERGLSALGAFKR